MPIQRNMEKRSKYSTESRRSRRYKIYNKKNLGYDEYVSFIKHRTVYSKEEFGFEHNIMLDEIEGVGYFAELELISHNETEKSNYMLKKLYKKRFECEKFGEERSTI